MFALPRGTSGVGIVFGCLALLVIWAALTALGTVIFQGLWNWIVPGLFDGPHVTFWQALGISMLLGFIGGSFRARVTS